MCRRFGGDLDFVKDEVDYLMSRFAPDDLQSYVSSRRIGRGQSPRMDTVTKQRLLDEVVIPYQAAKAELGWADWNDLAVAAADVDAPPWDVVVVDETQDFSANQLRTIMKHVAPDHQVTFVMDAAQQIYPRGFTWKEAGVETLTPRMLSNNYRNTSEIAAFARPLLEGLPLSEDGALPNFEATSRSGPKPVVLAGLYSNQLAWTIENVVKPAIDAGESVAFLKPRGGNWFRVAREALQAAGIPFAELTRRSTWPRGEENVAISTLHSAKGLEFDHVVILGLSKQVTPHGDEVDDTQLESVRRLVAMGVGRAKLTVTLGYKPAEESSVLSFLDEETYTAVTV
jgi:superfamily I DNA/RNA helicase